MSDLIEYYVRIWQGHIVTIQVLILIVLGVYLFFPKEARLKYTLYKRNIVFLCLLFFRL